jgi:hypothetical protein
VQGQARGSEGGAAEHGMVVDGWCQAGNGKLNGDGGVARQVSTRDAGTGRVRRQGCLRSRGWSEVVVSSGSI